MHTWTSHGCHTVTDRPDGAGLSVLASLILRFPTVTSCSFKMQRSTAMEGNVRFKIKTQRGEAARSPLSVVLLLPESVRSPTWILRSCRHLRVSCKYIRGQNDRFTLFTALQKQTRGGTLCLSSCSTSQAEHSLSAETAFI